MSDNQRHADPVRHDPICEAWMRTANRPCSCGARTAESIAAMSMQKMVDPYKEAARLKAERLADDVALRKVAEDLFEALRNFRNQYWSGHLVAGDDDWAMDAINAYKRLIDGSQ